MLEDILWWTAGISSGLFALKLLAMIFGVDSHGDFDAGGGADIAHGMGEDVQLLSITTIITFIMMGSWTALVALKNFEFNELQSIGAGLIGGVVMAYFVAWSLFQMRKLQSDGTLRDFNPSGLRGQVYMRIPASGQGEGQVQLEVEGRLRTFRAVSEGEAIDSFKPVVVTSMTKDHVMLVRPAN